MPCPSFYERKVLNFKNCANHHLALCRGLISVRTYKPGVCRCAIQRISPLYVYFDCVTTIAYQEMLSSSPTFGYRWHRLTEILWTGFSMCSRGPAAADSCQWFAAVDNKMIKWPNAQTISYTVIVSWISNHVHVKVWIEITDPFSDLTGLAAQWSVEMDK